MLDDARQHHRDGRRGAPHPGGRLRPQDARGAAERVPVRPDRHADQQARPQHVLWFGSPTRTRAATCRRYSFQDSIRDGATLPLHFEPRLSEIHIDQEAIDAAFAELGRAQRADRGREDHAVEEGRLDRGADQGSRADRDRSRPTSPSTSPAKVEPKGFKAQVVVFDKPTCVPTRPSSTSTCRPRRVDDRDVEEPRRPGRLGAVDARTREELEQIARPLQRPGRPAEVHHRHRQAAHRLRRADPAGAVPRQAAEGAHAAAGDQPHQPRLPAEQDARPDRRLPRHLRRRRQGARVRREVASSRSSPTSTSSRSSSRRRSPQRWRSSPASTAPSAATRA